MSTWEDLRTLRAQGVVPRLKLVICDPSQYILRKNFIDMGAMVIDVKGDEAVPVELLDGLDVWLFFNRCGESEAIAKALRECERKPERIRAWCQCSHDFTVIPGSCAQ